MDCGNYVATEEESYHLGCAAGPQGMWAWEEFGLASEAPEKEYSFYMFTVPCEGSPLFYLM